MTRFYSSIQAGSIAVPPGIAKAIGGAIAQRRFFTFTAATAVAAADDISVLELKASVVPLGGVIKLSAIATGGIMQFGKSGSVSAYATDTSANAITISLFDTIAKGFGVPLTEVTELLLTFKAATAGLAQGATLAGYIDFIEATG